MVWKARLDLPDPEGPVTTTSLPRGRSMSTPWRLWVRAPRILMLAAGTGAGSSGMGAAGAVAAAAAAAAAADLEIFETWLIVHVPERGRRRRACCRGRRPRGRRWHARCRG